MQRFSRLVEDMIHPGVKFGKGVRLGLGVIIEEGCEIGNDCMITHYVVMRPRVKLGDRCVVAPMTFFEGDTVVGNDVRVGPQSHLTRGMVIEDGVFIGLTLSTSNDMTAGRGHKDELKAPIIKKGARIGGNVTLLPGVVVGEYSLVGAHALVTRDVPPYALVCGVPARVVRYLDDESMMEKYEESIRGKGYETDRS